MQDSRLIRDAFAGILRDEGFFDLECVLKPIMPSCGTTPTDYRIGELNEAEVVLRMNVIANLQSAE